MDANGWLDTFEQFALTANAAELRDPFQVGVTPGAGKIQGDDLRNFLREKLIRTFVKKGVSPCFCVQLI